MPRVILLLVSLMVIFPFYSRAEDMIKGPNVAGAFYSADAKELSDSIDNFEMSTSRVPSDRKVLIAIAPHAGYPYSGPVAAYTFKAIVRNHYKTVVVIGPSHYFPFDGISVWRSGGFKTPLGVLGIDEDFAQALLKESPDFKFSPGVFEREHSVEVEMPFLQKTFKDIRIVPILMGNPDPKICKDLAVALNKIIGTRDDVLVLISSDMSHYYAYDEGNSMDAQALENIKALDAKQFFEGCMSRKFEMCGFVPVTTALILARLRGLSHVEVLKHANSGDATGDKSRVVGYSSVIFYSGLLGQEKQGSLEAIPALSKVQKQNLLQIAHQTLETFVKTGRVLDVEVKDERLKAIEGAFVTLRKHGALRGCIGNIIAQGPLNKTVRDMAVAAASQDPRFNPVVVDELKEIDIEISVLSVPRLVKDASEIELGRHGVIVSRGSRQGVFLPQVATETGWSKEEFLSELCSQKAGLAKDAWKDARTSLYVFTADVFAEK
ncbi:MAG: AmmeMemoRadiSam system protein B [Candidatus Omnitrophica bacterium]|nr:AmmeMemoRadiSam system protein B [Candidatus Omnitrophota bacterium]